jgi:hypothetical protein
MGKSLPANRWNAGIRPKPDRPRRRWHATRIIAALSRFRERAIRRSEDSKDAIIIARLGEVDDALA